jgi:hypothetical protein
MSLSFLIHCFLDISLVDCELPKSKPRSFHLQPVITYYLSLFDLVLCCFSQFFLRRWRFDTRWPVRMIAEFSLVDWRMKPTIGYSKESLVASGRLSRLRCCFFLQNFFIFLVESHCSKHHFFRFSFFVVCRLFF